MSEDQTAGARRQADELKAWIRTVTPGGCSMFSHGDRCRCPLCLVDALSAQLAAVQRDLTAARQEAEDERMRLAACTAAALGNTPESVAARLPRDHPYWSASYGDVCGAVDREMALREELSAARAQHEALHPALQEKSDYYAKCAKECATRQFELAMLYQVVADDFAEAVRRLLRPPQDETDK